MSTRIRSRPSNSIGRSIASRVVPADRRDDHPLGAGEPVDQRGLADVRAADHGQADRRPRPAASALLDRAPARRSGRAGHRCRAPAPPTPRSARRGRGDGTRPRAGCRATVSILLAATRTGSEPRRSRSADLVVAGPQRPPARRPRVPRRRRRRARPAPGRARRGELVAVVEVDPAGVDQRQRPAVPVGVELLAVAGDAGPLVDDRLARLGEAVDERGLADVRIPDDRDLHGGPEA